MSFFSVSFSSFLFIIFFSFFFFNLTKASSPSVERAKQTDIKVDSSSLSVKRPVEKAPTPMTKDSLSQTLIHEWSHLCSDCEFVIRSLSLPSLPQTLKKEKWSLNPISFLPRGSFSVSLRFEVKVKEVLSKKSALSLKGKQKASKSLKRRNLKLRRKPFYNSKIFWAHGKVDIYKKVPILKQVLKSRERIQEEDFEYSLEKVNFYVKRDVLKPPQIKGRRLRLNLQSGDIIWRESLLREKALKKGREWRFN